MPVFDAVELVGEVRGFPGPAASFEKAAPAQRPRNRYDRPGGDEGWFNVAKAMGLKFRWLGGGNPSANQNGQSTAEPGVPIRGLRNDVPVSFEKGGAVPGDRVVGVLMPGQGIRVFQIHSPLLKDHEHDRWIDVTWDINPETPERFPAHLTVTILNEPGTLAQIAQVIAEQDGNIDNLRIVKRGGDFTEMHVELEVYDLQHLSRIISGLKGKPIVSKVERVFE